MRNPGTCSLFLITMLAFPSPGDAAAQGSPADSAKSYVERGNSWIEKGEIERAIVD